MTFPAISLGLAGLLIHARKFGELKGWELSCRLILAVDARNLEHRCLQRGKRPTTHPVSVHKVSAPAADSSM